MEDRTTEKLEHLADAEIELLKAVQRCAANGQAAKGPRDTDRYSDAALGFAEALQFIRDAYRSK